MALLGVAFAVLLLHLVTYREAVHGPRVAFAAGVLLAAAGVVLAAGWCLARRAPGWAAPLLLLLVLLPGSVVHGRRWLQRRAPLDVTVTSPPQLRRMIEPELRGTSSVRLEPDGVRLDVPAGSLGYLELRTLTSADVPWDRPRALLSLTRPDVGEEYAWRATVMPVGRYFVLVETDRLLVQLTSWGLVVGEPGGASTDVRRPVPAGSAQEWSLRRAAGQVTLRLGDEVLWSGADAGPFRYVRLGETRTDAEHGGTLRLHSLRLARSLVPAGRTPTENPMAGGGVARSEQVWKGRQERRA